MFAADEGATREIAAEFAKLAKPGDVVLLEGELGAGKTTFVRGFLAALGHVGPVRSPTFNLIQTFQTNPPVMHADLYRIASASGLGLEDYIDSHISLIEWPKPGVPEGNRLWLVTIEASGEGREILINEGQEASL